MHKLLEHSLSHEVCHQRRSYSFKDAAEKSSVVFYIYGKNQYKLPWSFPFHCLFVIILILIHFMAILIYFFIKRANGTPSMDFGLPLQRKAKAEDINSY